MKHQRSRWLPAAAAGDEVVDEVDQTASGYSIHGLVSARAIARLLVGSLGPREGEVLAYLADGFSVREIAARLQISHTSVIRDRQKIAAAAVKLGVEPLTARSGRPLQIDCKSADDGRMRGAERTPVLPNHMEDNQ